MIEQLRKNVLIFGALLLGAVALYIWPSLLMGGPMMAFAVFAGKYRAQRDVVRKELASERKEHADTLGKMADMMRAHRECHQTAARVHQFRIHEAMAIELEMNADGMTNTPKNALISPRMIASVLYRRARFLRNIAPPPPPIPMSEWLGESQEKKDA